MQDNEALLLEESIVCTFLQNLFAIACALHVPRFPRSSKIYKGLKTSVEQTKTSREH
jgi:hypothetical protein